MAIITLTTDLGTKDSYLASVKGSIYSQLEDAKIVDISNDIELFNIQQATFVLRNCFQSFPKGTVHIISVDDELSVENEHLVVKANGHYFIGTDNGIFSLLLTEMKAEKIIQLNPIKKLEFPKVNKKLPTIISMDQIDKLILHSKNNKSPNSSFHNLIKLSCGV